MAKQPRPGQPPVVDLFEEIKKLPRPTDKVSVPILPGATREDVPTVVKPVLPPRASITKDRLGREQLTLPGVEYAPTEDEALMEEQRQEQAELEFMAGEIAKEEEDKEYILSVDEETELDLSIEDALSKSQGVSYDDKSDKAIEALNKDMGKYGIRFVNIGGNVRATATRTGKSIDVDLQQVFTNIFDRKGYFGLAPMGGKEATQAERDEAKKLKDFIKNNATAPMIGASKYEDDKILDESAKDYGTQGQDVQRFVDEFEERNRKKAFLESIEERNLTGAEQTRLLKKAGYQNVVGDGRDVSRILGELTKEQERSYAAYQDLKDNVLNKADAEKQKIIDEKKALIAKKAKVLTADMNLLKDDFRNRYGMEFSEETLNNMVFNSQAELDEVNKYINRANALAVQGNEIKKLYDDSNTYLNSKHDKDFKQEYVSAYQGMVNVFKNAWNRAKAGKIILAAKIDELNGGITPEDRESYNRRVAELMNKPELPITAIQYDMYKAMQSGNQWELLSLISNPLNFISAATTLASESFAQMIYLTGAEGGILTASGALIGGLAGGIASRSLAGARAGAAAGLRTAGTINATVGNVATNLAMETALGMYSALQEKYTAEDVLNGKWLDDPEIMDKAFRHGLTRGSTIGLTELIGYGVMSRFRVSSIANLPKRLAQTIAMGSGVEIAQEMTGEALAQVVSGEDLNAIEIIAEGLGAVGMVGANPFGFAKEVYEQVRTDYYTDLADNMAASRSFINNTKDSVEDVARWAKNMKQSGKISEDTERKIIDNISDIRQARAAIGAMEDTDAQRQKIMEKGTNSKAENRLADLFAAKRKLERVPDLNKPLQQAIKDEISEISLSKKVPSKGVDISSVVGTGPTYKYRGQYVTGRQLQTLIVNTPDYALDSLEIEIEGDEKMSQLLRGKAEERIDFEYDDMGEQVTFVADTKEQIPVRFRKDAQLNEETGMYEATVDKTELRKPKKDVSASDYAAFQAGNVSEAVLDDIADDITEGRKLTDKKAEIYKANKEGVLKRAGDMFSMATVDSGKRLDAAKTKLSRGGVAYAKDKRTGKVYRVDNAADLDRAYRSGMRILTEKPVRKVEGKLKPKKYDKKRVAPVGEQARDIAPSEEPYQQQPMDTRMKFQQAERQEAVRKWKSAQEISAFKDLATRVAGRIGATVKFINDPNEEYRGYYDPRMHQAVINLAYATSETVFHEILGHPIILAMKSNPEYAQLYENLKNEVLNSPLGQEVLANVREKYNFNNEDDVMEEAIVQLLGMRTDEAFSEKANLKLLSQIKKWLKEMAAWVRDTLRKQGITIEDFPVDATIEDIGKLLGYSNQNIILPGFVQEFKTPTGLVTENYADVQAEMALLAGGIKVERTSKVDEITALETKMATIISSDNNYPNNPEYIKAKKELEKIVDELLTDGKVEVINPFNGMTITTIESRDGKYYIGDVEASASDVYKMVDGSKRIAEYIKHNEEFARNKSIILNWKEANGIVYNPEEAYSRGYVFTSEIGLYSNFDTIALLQNLMDLLDDVDNAGGEIVLSTGLRAAYEPDDADNLMNIGQSLQIIMYPAPDDILWASDVDVMSGTVAESYRINPSLDAVDESFAKAVSGTSLTKYPGDDYLDSIQPNIADCILPKSKVYYSVNEQAVRMNGNNWRIQYRPDAPLELKKLADTINGKLDEKYGPISAPKIARRIPYQVGDVVDIEGQKFEILDSMQVPPSTNIFSRPGGRLSDSETVLGSRRFLLKPLSVTESGIESLRARFVLQNRNYFNRDDFSLSISELELPIRLDTAPVQRADTTEDYRPADDGVFSDSFENTMQQYDTIISEAKIASDISALRSILKKYPRAMVMATSKMVNRFSQDIREKFQKPTEGGVSDRGDVFSIDGKTKFFHASDQKRRGRLKKSTALQFGSAVYFSTSKQLVMGEFGDNVTEVELDLKNPVYTNTKQWSEVEELAIKLADDDYGRRKNLKLEEDETYFRFTLGDFDEIPSRFISQAAEQLGYDAIVDKNSHNYENEIAVLNEAAIIYEEDTRKFQKPSSALKDVESTAKALEEKYSAQPIKINSIVNDNPQEIYALSIGINPSNLFYLGKGDYGEAYSTDSGTVIKITSSANEAEIALSLIGKKGDHAEIYDVKKVGSKFIIYQEKLDTDSEIEDNLQTIENILNEQELPIQYLNYLDYDELSQESKDKYDSLSDFISDLKDINRLYNNLGIEASDLQSGNLGYGKNGKLKAFDLQDKSSKIKSKDVNAGALKDKNQVISEAYHKAKKDGSNPELVKAVEELLSPQETDTRIKYSKIGVPSPAKSNDIVDEFIEARSLGYPDDAIERMLLSDGYEKDDVKALMELGLPNVITGIKEGETIELPASFANAAGGAEAGTALYNRVRNGAIDAYINRRKDRVEGQAPIGDRIVDHLVATLKADDTFKASPKDVQQAMLVDIVKSSDVRLTKNKRAWFNREKIKQKGIEQGKRIDSKLKGKLISYIIINLPKAFYTKKDVKQLLQKVKAATTTNIMAIQEEVLDFVTKTNVGIVKEKINALLKKDTTKQKSGREVGAISMAAQEYMDGVEALMMKEGESSGLQIESSIQRINEQLSALLSEYESAPYSQREAMENQMSILYTALMYNSSLLIEDTNDGKLEALEEVLAAMKEVLAEGKADFIAEIKAATEKYNNMKAAFFEDITGGMEIDYAASEKEKQEVMFQLNQIKQGRENVNWLQRIGNLFVNAIKGTEDIDALLDRIALLPSEFFDNGIAKSIISGKIFDSRREQARLKKMTTEMIRDAAKKIFGENYKKVMANNAKSTITVTARNGRSVIMSLNEAYYYYNMYKDPANHPSFQTTFGDDYHSTMYQIIERLSETPKILDWADWQVDVMYPILYDEYNAVYRRIYRTDMPWNRFYAGRIYRDGVDMKSPIDIFSPTSPDSQEYFGGTSTKSRKENKNAIKQVDGDYVLFNYLEDMNFFASFGESLRDINKILSDKYIAKAIEAKHSKEDLNNLREMIKRIYSQGLGDSNISEFFGSGMKNFITAKLAFNPKIMIQQMGTFVGYIPFIGYTNWGIYAGKVFFDKIRGINTWKEMVSNSQYLTDRFSDIDIREVLSGVSAARSKKLGVLPDGTWDKILSMSMIFMRAGDQMGIMGAMPNYLYYKESFMKQGRTEEQAIAFAIQRIEKQTQKVAQSNFEEDKDLYQTGSAFARAFSIFASQPKQYFRQEVNALRNMYRILANTPGAKGTFRQNLRAFITYHFVAPLMFQWIVSGFPGWVSEWDDDDKEDMIWAAILGNINAIFIIGDLFVGVKDVITGKPWAGKIDSLPVLMQIGDVLDTFSSMYNAKKEETRWKNAAKLASQMAEFTGLPAGIFYRYIMNYIEFTKDKDNFGESVLRLLGYSDYVVKGANKQKKSSSAKLKTDRLGGDSLKPAKLE